MATVPRLETIRTRSTCAEERAARSAASGAPTRQRFSRHERVIFHEPGFRMQSGPSRSNKIASASSPPTTVERGGAQRCARHPQPSTPDREAGAEEGEGAGGVDQEKS